jgi:hypothetical protein
LRNFPKKIAHGERKYCSEKIVTAMFKLEVDDFAKEKGNREAARKFNVGETSGQEGRKEEAPIKCLH